MHIRLDETMIETSAVSVGEAIAAASEIAQTRGRMIVEVIVDGMSFSQEQLGSEQMLTQTAEEVRLISADPAELAVQVLKDASGALTEVDRLQQDAAELIQADQTVSAMEKLGQAISIWQSVQQAVSLCVNLIDVNLDELQVHEISASLIVNQLNEQLQAMCTALESHDPVGLSDTLLYELPTVVRQWQDLFSLLQDRVLDTQRETTCP